MSKKKAKDQGDILGDRFDKKEKKYLGSKETQLHAKDSEEGNERAANRARKEVMQEAGIPLDRFLIGGQAKLDKNKNNKIDAEDFALLRKEKAKPMKAVLGALAVGAVGAMGAKKFFKKKKATATPGMGAIRGSGTGLGGMAAGLVSKKMKELGLDKTSLMGGGMAMKVPGYSKGKSVMARGCKLGRKKPTKMY